MKVNYVEHLSKDNVIGPLIGAIELPILEKRDNIYLRLCTSVIGQQLSTHVAKVIFKRFLELYNGAEPSPEQILRTSFEDLRSIGLSNAKAGYVQNIARFMIENNLSDEDIHGMEDVEIVETLTQIKGVGKCASFLAECNSLIFDPFSALIWFNQNNIQH